MYYEPVGGVFGQCRFQHVDHLDGPGGGEISARHDRLFADKNSVARYLQSAQLPVAVQSQH